jgi:hypothetical protein
VYSVVLSCHFSRRISLTNKARRDVHWQSSTTEW